MSDDLPPICASFTEADLVRLRRERESRVGEKGRVRCRRCRGAIPEGKRADAVYCSVACKRRYRWEKRNELTKEIRDAVRGMKVVAQCECGEPLDTRVRPGPVPKQCKKCYFRDAQRQYRERKRSA